MQTSPSQSASTLIEISKAISQISSLSVENCAQKGLCLRLQNEYGCVVVSIFGGHVLSYVNKGDNKERLWLSKEAIFDGKTPIRGGIPICWPWFSSHPVHKDYPSHGYARTQMFTLIDKQETHMQEKVVSTTVTLQPSEMCQYDYVGIDMKLVITLSTSLHIQMVTTNQSTTPIWLTQALHSYFAIDDITQTRLLGVTTAYDDKLNDTSNNTAPRPYDFAEEVDRIHFTDKATFENKQLIEIVRINEEPNDNKHSPTLHKIEQIGHDSTVVWNPWVNKSRSMKDMQNDGYQRMLCIEAANTVNAENPLVIMPEQSHSLSQVIT